MAPIQMSQNINIMIASLARTFPDAKISISSFGPISVQDGKLHVGAGTRTEVALGDVPRKEPHLLSAGELQADRDHRLAKKLIKAAATSRASRRVR